MATAEVMPTIESVQQLEPGVQASEHQDPVLPPQGGLIFSNVLASFLPPDQLLDPRPSRVLFAGLRDPRLRMVKAIPLDICVEESTVIASWPEINEFGSGETMGAALDDFGSGLRELYHRLFAPEINLGRDLRNVKGILERYIQPRR